MFLPRKSKVDRRWDGVLRVPFEQKAAAKALGAVWDAALRTWVVPPALRGRRHDFQKWDTHSRDASTPGTTPHELQLKRASITRELALQVCPRHA
jgi:hypothetical protein